MRSFNDRKRPYHLASKMGPNGEVSALCFKRPKAIDLKKATWTIRDEAVTCKRCLELIAKGERGGAFPKTSTASASESEEK